MWMLYRFWRIFSIFSLRISQPRTFRPMVSTDQRQLSCICLTAVRQRKQYEPNPSKKLGRSIEIMLHLIALAYAASLRAGFFIHSVIVATLGHPIHVFRWSSLHAGPWSRPLMHSTTNCSRVFIFIAQVAESLCSLMWRCAFICFVQPDGVSSTLLLGSQTPLTFKRDRSKVLLKQADYWKTWKK